MRRWLLTAGLVALTACRTEPASNQTAAPASPSAQPAVSRTSVTPLAVGERVPASVLAGARHWARGGAAGNRILVINFNRSRCAAGEACASAQEKLRRLHDEVRASRTLKESAGLLTLSADPFDLPAVLRAHADRIGADAEVWRFAALPASEADEVQRQFGASPEVNVTVIVDAAGTVAKIYAGNDWTAEDLIRDVKSLVLRADPAVLRAYIDAQEALAADAPGDAKRALARLAAAVPEPAVSRLAKTAAAGADLAAVRAGFKPLSEALVRLPWPPEYQPMYCPMFDGNAGATWVQKAGPVVNPYYGKTMLRCGTDLSAGAHADHSPKFGGVLFMAADAFHHVEGTYTRDGVFRVRLYDNFRRPMNVSGFSGRVEVGQQRTAFRLRPAADPTILEVRVGELRFPAEITLHMVLDSRGPEERFDFIFAEYSPNPGTM